MFWKIKFEYYLVINLLFVRISLRLAYKNNIPNTTQIVFIWEIMRDFISLS